MDKTSFYAGYWNNSHTLAKVELELVEGTGAWVGWRITKVLKVYAGGKGMLAGMFLLEDEVESSIFNNYTDAQKKAVSDCLSKISETLSHAEVFAKEMKNIREMVE